MTGRKKIGFNEAAGIPRGRLGELGAQQGGSHASMRPRVFPAEDYSVEWITP